MCGLLPNNYMSKIMLVYDDHGENKTHTFISVVGLMQFTSEPCQTEDSKLSRGVGLFKTHNFIPLHSYRASSSFDTLK